MPSKLDMRNAVITELRETDGYRYDLGNDLVYRRHGMHNIWLIDNNKTELYKMVVFIVDDQGHGYTLEPKDLDVIVEKFIKMTRDIHITNSNILSQFTNDDDDEYMTINLPLRDKVLVIDRKFESYELRDYRATDFFTVFFDVDWVDRVPRTPKFDKFMKWFQKDKFLRDYLLKSAGMLYMPLYSHWNNVLYLYGNGNNGKSVFTDIVSVFYDNVFKSFSRFEEISNDFGLESIYTKWLNVGEESKPSFDEDLSNIRVMAAHGITDIRRKHKPSSVGIKMKTKSIFNGNVAPILKNDGDYRRIGIVACKNKIDNVNLDTELTSRIIRDEGNDIFKKLILKAIEAMDNIKNERNKFIDISRTQIEFTEDPIKFFIDDYIEYDDKHSGDYKTSLSGIYEAYVVIAERFSFPLFSQRQIIKKVRSVFNLKGSVVVNDKGGGHRGLKHITISEDVIAVKQATYDEIVDRFGGYDEYIEESNQDTE